MTLRRTLERPARLLRRLRWQRASWSKASDQHYHDQLYAAQGHDAFAPAYPGYITIRRFADHAEALLPPTGRVLDLGCGPGEITCEVARRRPHLSFVGLDHSAQAVERALANAARLRLTNVEFRRADGEALPSERWDCVMMFDAFHHFERPEAVVSWLRGHTSRVLLVEPAGTWTGQWGRTIDIDWLLTDLANVRDRLEAVCGAAEATVVSPTTSDAEAPQQGEGAVERRYALDDFERMFAEWSLSITGTVAGFDRYPPAPHAASPLRPLFAEAAYLMAKSADALLVERQRDGHAKHWVVAASTEPGLVVPRMPSTGGAPSTRTDTARPRSACDVRYTNVRVPTDVRAGQAFSVRLTLVNEGWDTWASAGPQPTHLSYHWYGADGSTVVVFDGERTALAEALAPGQRVEIDLRVQSPEAPGSYVLAVDMVKEGLTWFSAAGAHAHTARVHVRP